MKNKCLTCINFTKCIMAQSAECAPNLDTKNVLDRYSPECLSNFALGYIARKSPHLKAATQAYNYLSKHKNIEVCSIAGDTTHEELALNILNVCRESDTSPEGMNASRVAYIARRTRLLNVGLNAWLVGYKTWNKDILMSMSRSARNKEIRNLAKNRLTKLEENGSITVLNK